MTTNDVFIDAFQRTQLADQGSGVNPLCKNCKGTGVIGFEESFNNAVFILSCNICSIWWYDNIALKRQQILCGYNVDEQLFHQ